MTKEELIALSDLNREDNIRYISSEAQGIAIALDSDGYALTLCKLERAYICGRRKSEKRITELEKENAELKDEVKNNEELATVAYMQGAENQKKKVQKQLAKAKDLLRKFLKATSIEETCVAESEAEEWVKENLHNTEEDYKKAFKDGAEYGYKLAQEEMDYLNSHWRGVKDKEEDKWHYPSKGELPDVMQEVIICLKNEKTITRAKRINSDLWTSPTSDYFTREILAWRDLLELPI